MKRIFVYKHTIFFLSLSLPLPLFLSLSVFFVGVFASKTFFIRFIEQKTVVYV